MTMQMKAKFNQMLGHLFGNTGKGATSPRHEGPGQAMPCLNQTGLPFLPLFNCCYLYIDLKLLKGFKTHRDLFRMQCRSMKLFLNMF